MKAEQIDAHGSATDAEAALTAYLKKLVPVSFSLPKNVARKSVVLLNGQTVEGRVLNEGMNDLQLYSDAGPSRVHLLRKNTDGRYREVTSQTDWPTYHGDNSGNRYTKLAQIDKANVARFRLGTGSRLGRKP